MNKGIIVNSSGFTCLAHRIAVGTAGTQGAATAAVGLAIAALLCSSVQARELEEIVVTAERRAENLQEVPNAITALSETTIEQADIHDLTDIATRVPGLTFSPFSPGQNIVALRGAVVQRRRCGDRQPVSVFVDDVYLGRVSNINPEMFDIERIEVLRGPQGTLYGKNTIGGAINVVSAKPNLEALEGKVRVSVGNYERRDVAGLLSGPLGDRWAAKASFSFRKRDGWVENVYLDKQQKDDACWRRGQLLYAGDDLEALFSADFNRLDIEDMARTPIATGEPGDPAFWAANIPGSYADLCRGRGAGCSAGPVDGYAEREAWGLSMKLNWRPAAGELISITAYRENEADWNMDSSGTPVSPLPPLFNQINDDIFDSTEQFTQELRWVSGLGETVDYITGLWFLTEKTDRTECFDNDVLPSDCTPTADGGATDWYRQVNETTSYAAFGQVDWRFSEGWELTLGGRYSYDKKKIDNDAIAGDFVVINQTFSNSVSENWSAFTPKIALAYLPSDNATIYGAVSWGFKSGGFAAAPQGIEFTEPLDQEEALNYEVGIKVDLGGSFRLNAAVFSPNTKDLTDPDFRSADGPAASNLPDVHAGDAESSAQNWKPPDRDRPAHLSGFYAYQDSKFGDTIIPGTAWTSPGWTSSGARAQVQCQRVTSPWPTATNCGDPELALHDDQRANWNPGRCSPSSTCSMPG